MAYVTMGGIAEDLLQKALEPLPGGKEAYGLYEEAEKEKAEAKKTKKELKKQKAAGAALQAQSDAVKKELAKAKAKAKAAEATRNAKAIADAQAEVSKLEEAKAAIDAQLGKFKTVVPYALAVGALGLAGLGLYFALRRKRAAA